PRDSRTATTTRPAVDSSTIGYQAPRLRMSAMLSAQRAQPSVLCMGVTPIIPRFDRFRYARPRPNRAPPDSTRVAEDGGEALAGVRPNPDPRGVTARRRPRRGPVRAARGVLARRRASPP